MEKEPENARDAPGNGLALPLLLLLQPPFLLLPLLLPTP
uniref:Uncharacterized protein n=1 Tax=Rhizophora mucronata TaxID=61149 RepID=A0A2P2NF86_RHIMU